MNCNKIYDRDTINKAVGKSWFDTTYRRQLKDILFEIEKSRLPETSR